MAKIQMTDMAFEVLFRQAVVDAFNEELNTTPTNEALSLNYKISPEFENRMTKLIDAADNRRIPPKIMFYSRRVAILFIISISLLLSTMLLNTDVHAAIKKVLIEWYENFTSFIFQDNEVEDGTTYEWHINYIPEGYSLSESAVIGRVTNIEYTNHQNEIIRFSYRPDSGGTNISVDNENHKIENGMIILNDAYFITALDDLFDNGIIWTMDDHIFYLWSKLPLDELTKVAESISAEK